MARSGHLYSARRATGVPPGRQHSTDGLVADHAAHGHDLVLAQQHHLRAGVAQQPRRTQVRGSFPNTGLRRQTGTLVVYDWPGDGFDHPPLETWPADFRTLAEQLRAAPDLDVVAIDHIGSTAVPGLPAKDVIDAQVIVQSLAPHEHILGALAAVGFGQRPGDWNLRDNIPSGWGATTENGASLSLAPSRVSGPRMSTSEPQEARMNATRCCFRDYLRGDPAARCAWGEFKTRLAVADNRESYGQVKDPDTDILLLAAEPWAVATGWTVAKSRSAA